MEVCLRLVVLEKGAGDMKSCTRKNCTMINPQPFENFGICRRLPSGLRPECKTCRKIEAATAYKKDPSKFLVRNARWALNNPVAAKKAKIESELNSKPYRRFKKNECEHCSFMAIDPCQLDVDHIDGNHSNNDPSNLQTLCANCHRLKTKVNKDGCYSSDRFKLKVVA